MPFNFESDREANINLCKDSCEYLDKKNKACTNPNLHVQCVCYTVCTKNSKPEFLKQCEECDWLIKTDLGGRVKTGYYCVSPNHYGEKKGWWRWRLTNWPHIVWFPDKRCPFTQENANEVKKLCSINSAKDKNIKEIVIDCQNIDSSKYKFKTVSICAGESECIKEGIFDCLSRFTIAPRIGDIGIYKPNNTWLGIQSYWDHEYELATVWGTSNKNLLLIHGKKTNTVFMRPHGFKEFKVQLGDVLLLKKGGTSMYLFASSYLLIYNITQNCIQR